MLAASATHRQVESAPEEREQRAQARKPLALCSEKQLWRIAAASFISQWGLSIAIHHLCRHQAPRALTSAECRQRPAADIAAVGTRAAQGRGLLYTQRRTCALRNGRANDSPACRRSNHGFGWCADQGAGGYYCWTEKSRGSITDTNSRGCSFDSLCPIFRPRMHDVFFSNPSPLPSSAHIFFFSGRSP